MILPVKQRLSRAVSVAMGMDSSSPDPPSSAEVREAITRVTQSNSFKNSPQLRAFLSFVVEAWLRGEDHLKAYTIGVEALGRKADFDPQADPIVRVEAGRVRRALDIYYSGTGSGDPIIIDLPRGSYGPVFHHRAAAPAAPDLSHAGEGATDPRRQRTALWLTVAIVIGILGGVVGTTVTRNALMPRAPPGTGWTTAALKAGNGMPTIFVARFDIDGGRGTGGCVQSPLEGIRTKIRDALVRFDELNVASAENRIASADADAESLRSGESRAEASVYRLLLTAECFGRDMDMSFTLVDGPAGPVVWTKRYAWSPDANESGAAVDRIIGAVAADIAQPFGVIAARERNKPGNDPRYACLLRALDYMRGFQEGVHEAIRTCLEKSTEVDPTFALGYAALALLYQREFYSGVGARPGDVPAPVRALAAAQRAVHLKPQSARAFQVLSNIYYLRNELPAAWTAAEKAVSLNPYDPYLLTDYAIRLVGAGDFEKGEKLFDQLSTSDVVLNTTPANFALFFLSYRKGDLAAASRYANLGLGDTPLSLLSRLLVASAGGENAETAALIERLGAKYPAFRSDTRQALARLFPSTELQDRMMRDLAAAGLPDTGRAQPMP